MEKGGMVPFTALSDLKKPDNNVSAMPTTPEPRHGITTPRAEAVATNSRDLPIISASQPVNRNNVPPPRPPPPAAEDSLFFSTPPTHLPPPEARDEFPFPASSARPSISADELPSRTTSLNQRRLSFESTRTAKTIPTEVDDSKCANPFHETECDCRKSVITHYGHESLYSLYAGSFSRPRYESGTALIHEGASEPVSDSADARPAEGQRDSRYDMGAVAPPEKTEDTSVGIGMAR